MLIAKKPWLMPGTYAVIILALFLPFCNIKCGGMKIATIQGTDMILKGKVSLAGNLNGLDKLGEGFGNKEEKKEEKKLEKERNADINYWVILVALAAIGGITVHFLKLKPQFTIQTGIAALGILALLIFALTKNSYLNLEELGKKNGSKELDDPFSGGGIISVGLDIGYWISLAAFIAAAYFGYTSRVLDKPQEIIFDEDSIISKAETNAAIPPNGE